MNDRFSLEGQVALVTGAGRGLGTALAEALADAGARVVAHERRHPADRVVDVKLPSGREALGVGGDLADPACPERMVAAVLAGAGRIDVLVNNAGIIRRAPAAEHSDEDWDAVIAVNLTAAFKLCRAAGRHMLERGSGRIVNIASLLSFQGGITVPGYAAAKGGLAQLTKALSNEWAGRGVGVNAIAPGYMETDNTAALRADPTRQRQILERIPAARWGKPEDLAGAVLFLASPAASYVHGHVLVVDGGWLGR
jgi:2-deoxy-D-gluconate 3-dehydrogenase